MQQGFPYSYRKSCGQGASARNAFTVKLLLKGLMTMPEAKGLPEQKPRTGAPAKAAIPPEIRLLADVVIQLNILKKNLAIYPDGHHLITQSTAAALQALEKNFLANPTITIGASKETLFLGGRRIETKNPTFRDVAATLSRLGIAAVFFSHGIQEEELLKLLRMLSMRPANVRDRGGISAIATEAGLKHVRIKLLDYSMFRATEEAEIKGPSESPQPADLITGSDLWGRFTRGFNTGPKKVLAAASRHENGGELVESGILDSGAPVIAQGGGDGMLQQGTELDENAEDALSPGKIVQQLNDGTLAVELALENYAEVLAHFAGMGFQRSLLGKESLRFFERMNVILHNLKPAIRERFLNAAQKNLLLMPDDDSREELLKCFPTDLAAEMLGIADLDGNQLSPALHKLMVKLSAVQDDIADSGLQRSTVSSRDALPFMDALQILPKREDYERHMTDDYAEQLNDMQTAPTVIAAPEDFNLDEHLQSLGRQSLDMHIGRVLIALMDQDIESSSYHDFTQKVIELVPALLDAGSFRPMFIIFSTLRQHAVNKQEADIRALAKMAIQIFYEPAFVRQLVSQLAEAGDDASGDLLALLQETGQQVIPELIDLYANELTTAGSQRLFDLLCSFENLSVDVALTRLHHRSFHYVRNLLQLIKAAGDPSVITTIRPLLKHQDRQIRHEALEVLLHFKDPGAIATLRQQLRTRNMAEVSRAVLMIHTYRLQGFNTELLSLIKIFMLFHRDMMLNCMVLQALGELGDASVLPSLQKIARARLTLSPGNLKKTKLALYESLASYPQGVAVKDIAAIGLRSGNEQIRRLCSSLGA